MIYRLLIIIFFSGFANFALASESTCTKLIGESKNLNANGLPYKHAFNKLAGSWRATSSNVLRQLAKLTLYRNIIGRDQIAVGANDNHLYFIDLYIQPQQREVSP